MPLDIVAACKAEGENLVFWKAARIPLVNGADVVFHDVDSLAVLVCHAAWTDTDIVMD
jgi:hypothetical protein